MCPSFTEIIPDLIPATNALYLAPVAACGGTGVAGGAAGAPAAFIMERIMWPNMSTHARYAK